MGVKPDVEIRTARIDDLGAIFHLDEKVFTSQEVSNLCRTWDEYEETHLFNSESEHVLVALAAEIYTHLLQIM